ncbi:MAG: hypothetical protein M3R48_08295 [Candidatus Dormibacteraeota bacterium]|nr:hypothetical protein [Candidatus Dormibacteraeota bacterium]
MPQRPFSRSASDSSSRRTYEILDEPAGDDYVALLRAASGECATGAVTAPSSLTVEGRAVVDALRGPAAAMLPSPGSVVRFSITEQTLDVLAGRASTLYSWRTPSLPDSLCLFRPDGSPWLISVAGRRLGYIELTVLERVRLSHVAPAVAASLANRAARDAILGSLERRLEERTQSLVDDVRGYVRDAAADSREVLVDALLTWLISGDDVRAAVAVELTGSMQLTEMREPLEEYSEWLRSGDSSPPVFADHPVLRDRWIARRLRLVRDSLSRLPT